jgi:hypothetical protein
VLLVSVSAIVLVTLGLEQAGGFEPACAPLGMATARKTIEAPPSATLAKMLFFIMEVLLLFQLSEALMPIGLGVFCLAASLARK